MMHNQPTYSSHRVWDQPTRWLHWIIVLAVVALAFTGYLVYYRQVFYIEGADAKLALKKLHALVGYVLATSVLLRIVWGFAGNRFARFASVLPPRNVVRASLADLRSIVARQPNSYLGRSPLSRCSATALYALLIAMTVSGLVMMATGLMFPPFGGLVQSYLAAPGIDPATIRPGSATGIDPARLRDIVRLKDAFAQIHIWSGYTLMVVMVVHVAGAVFADARKGGALISAMFTGNKIMATEPVDADPPPR